jgi:type IV pilus assembly protein PilE
MSLIRSLPRGKCQQSGVTLLELLTVITIIGILAAIAYPSYVNQIRKSKRAVAKSVLLDASNREEQYFFTNSTYTGTVTDLGYSSPYFGDDNSPSTAADAVYKLTLTVVNSGPGTCGTDPAPCFQANAIPQHDQVNDTACGTFTLTSSNTKGAAGTDCW